MKLGTPRALLGMKEILENVEHEAELFKKHNIHGVIIENMNDTPYCLEKDLGIGLIILICMAFGFDKIHSDFIWI